MDTVDPFEAAGKVRYVEAPILASYRAGASGGTVGGADGRMNARAGAAVGAGGASSPRRKAAWAASLLVGTPSTGVTSNDANSWVGRCGQGSTAGETSWRGGAAARGEASGWVT